MTVSLLLSLSLVLAAKPIAREYKGPLDAVDVSQQSAGTLVRFDSTDRAGAEAAITRVARAVKVTDALTVAFIRTDAGALAALQVQGDGRLPFDRFTELARRLSAEPGVAAAWAYLAPGPRDDSLEQEAVYRFERGAAVDEARLQYRADPVYLEHVRRKTSATAFHQARWPSYPLSRLALELKLPGRACLDEPWQLHTLATLRWPIDAGENLSVAWVDLPGGIATEIQQHALKEKRSPSSVVLEALVEARKAKQLAKQPEHELFAKYDEGQPDSEKHARRSVTLFLPEAELDAAEDSGAAEAISLSRTVQYAWRRAHPHENR